MSYPFLKQLFLLSVLFTFSSVFVGGIDASNSKPLSTNSQSPPAIGSIDKIQLPFIENDGQYDDVVRFYARTFSGVAFVTNDGRIVYSMPDRSSDGGQINLALQERLLGRNRIDLRGIAPATCQINIFKGHQPNQWQSGLSSYNIVD
ncbi:MAG: hypothetical protein V3V99_05365, partial [candidate division Zixibacteria bacterium]